MAPQPPDHFAILASGLFGVGGVILGVLLAYLLGNRSRKKEWVRDHRRSEYRKLLDTISGAGSKLIVFYETYPRLVEGKELFEIGEVARQSADVIYNRLFIGKEVQELDILGRWTRAISTLRNDHDASAFSKSMDGIMGGFKEKGCN